MKEHKDKIEREEIKNAQNQNEKIESDSNGEIHLNVKDKHSDAHKKEKHERSKKHKKEDYLEDLQRLQAEFDNYRKRVAKEKLLLKQYVVEEILSELLPVLDNFSRALESFKENEELPEVFVEGVEMIYNQLIGVFKKYGVEEIKSVGNKFDPNIHEAVGMEESDDDGIVLKELQKGYRIGEKVIRPSSVIVSKKKSNNGVASIDSASDKN